MIKESFLICGFPRSRTMWLSRFLSLPMFSLCTHEATEHAGSAQEFWQNAEAYAQSAGAQFYGNSDSANILVLPALLAHRPLTRTVWIERPIEEVFASMAAAKLPFEHKSAATLIALRDEYETCFDIVVEYRALASWQACKQIWDFVLPGMPFNFASWAELDRWKIGYSAQNPPGPRKVDKFLGWVKEELSAHRAA